ncbi:polysaccharide deacetylase family protein [Mobilitalea sibirica]|uniref:Polysaccharide deacetylase family protein n=1 Tax=Mobilitalea sibirica TaxID=1462919 RepID=A0A8J7H7M7_9FIRM|nr:polysaccharide deacetylase family protein [Mobilitalea sibirica]MBH1939560.1 polysaccharide deacetylase family protein [Mobilitalea sibirica]
MDNITLFVKLGIIILSIFVIIGLGITFLPDAISVSTSGNRRDLPIYSVDTEENQVALTFDTAWGNEYIQTILDILAKYDIKATFFMTGEWIEKYPKDVKNIYEQGHDLGNHTENHKHMSLLSIEECAKEIMQAHKRVKELTGFDMSLFRAPFGDYNNAVIGAARDCGYYSIQWDIDSLDWKDYGAENIVNKTVYHKKLNKGSILLFHNGAKYTPQALEKVIVGLQDKGYEIVPVSQLIHKGEHTIDQKGRQYKM